MADVTGFVLNGSGTALGYAEDSTYIEVPGDEVDEVINDALSGDEESASDKAVLSLSVADLVTVYNAAKALMHSERAWVKRAAEREALAVAVAKAGPQ